MAVSREQYRQILQREQKRFGASRDEAVRRANIAAGFGNSTAQRFMGAAASGGKKAAPASGGGKPKASVDRTKTASTSPFRLPKRAPRPTPNPNRDVTSPSAAGDFFPTQSMTSVANTPPTRSPTSEPGLPGFGATSPSSLGTFLAALSPTSVPGMPSMGPTTVPGLPSRGPTTVPGLPSRGPTTVPGLPMPTVSPTSVPGLSGGFSGWW